MKAIVHPIEINSNSNYTENCVYVTVSLPIDVYKEISKEAEVEVRTLSNFIQYIIIKHLRKKLKPRFWRKRRDTVGNKGNQKPMGRDLN